MLKYITNLGTSPKTRALSLRLLNDVTVVQSKAFPHLVTMIHKYKRDTSLEMKLACAVSIHHICDQR